MKNSHDLKETHKNVASNLLATLGRIIAGSYYDHQQVRIAEMNRVRDIIRRKIEGLPLVGKVEEKKKVEEKYKEKFKDKEIPKYLRDLVKENKITEKEKAYIERIIEVQKNAEKYEKEYQKLMMDFVESEPIYTEFLSKIKGISAVLSANLIKELGYCENAPYISSVWKYFGLHVVNGEAPKRKKGVKLNFNLKLRTLAWKIADSFVKQRTPFYRDIYDKEKAKQLRLMESHYARETHEEIASQVEEETRKYVAKPPKNKKHADLRARRKMVKIFLAHYWQACKELNQEPEENQNFTAKEPSKRRNPDAISKPYVEAKLKHKHITSWKEAVAVNELAKLKGNKVEKDKIATTKKKPIWS